MSKITLTLPPEVFQFYANIAKTTGLSPEQVMADALFKLAGELSLEALKGRNS